MKFLQSKVDTTVDDAVDRTTMRLTDKVKLHFKLNKKVYLAFGAGVGLCLIANGRSDVSVKSNTKFLSISSPDNSTNVVVTQLTRRGHPGNLVRCKETGEVFASQQRAAESLGLNASQLSQHLRGVGSDVKGLTFEKLGEAQ